MHHTKKIAEIWALFRENREQLLLQREQFQETKQLFKEEAFKTERLLKEEAQTTDRRLNKLYGRSSDQWGRLWKP